MVSDRLSCFWSLHMKSKLLLDGGDGAVAPWAASGIGGQELSSWSGGWAENFDRIASTTLEHDQQPWKLRDAQASGLQCQSCEVHSDKWRETYPPVDTRTVRDRSFPEKWNSRSGHSEHVQFQNTTDCHKLPDWKCESWIWMGSISYCSLPLYLAGCWDQRLVTVWPFGPLTVFPSHWPIVMAVIG